MQYWFKKSYFFYFKFRISSLHELSLSDSWKVWSFLRQKEKRVFPVYLEVEKVLNDHSGKLTFNCDLKLPLYPPEKKGMGRSGNLVCILLLLDDHHSPCIFVPRKRFQGNCTISIDSVFLPLPTVCMPTVMQTWLTWSSAPTLHHCQNISFTLLRKAQRATQDLSAQLLPITPQISLSSFIYWKRNLKKTLISMTKVCYVEHSPQTLHVFMKELRDGKP